MMNKICKGKTSKIHKEILFHIIYIKNSKFPFKCIFNQKPNLFPEDMLLIVTYHKLYKFIKCDSS
jgi:hypothetical protein